MPSDGELLGWLADARRRVRELTRDLPPEARLGPRLPIVNPPLWEVGHLGWFHERWVLREARGEDPLRADGDLLWDSSRVAHGTRWNLPLPSWEETWAYLDEVERQVIDRLSGEVDPQLAYFARLSVFHEDMHGEAFLYTRQTLGYSPPQVRGALEPPTGAGRLAGDAEVPGGAFWLGARPDEPFVFDNEKWAHPREVRPFAIARAAVTQAEYAAFVDDGGYRRRDVWSEEGWRWRESHGAEMPVYWRRAAGGLERRWFDRWVALEPDLPVLHVCWFEADAYCRWAGRRLPSELEWEVAAAGEPDGGGGLAPRSRRFPWGDDAPTPARANLDLRLLGPVDVGAHAAGDSAFGCRQMIGNTWEWTSSAFEPYPGFTPDPYADYSAPWFGDHRVLRGGCFATRARLLRNTWRNFYQPHRRDVLAGFRTCR